MSVARICTREVDTVDPEETAQVAARRMHDRKVGTLVVLDKDNAPTGILTDRDLAVRVVAEGKDPRKTLVQEVMTGCPATAQEDTPVEDAISVMRSGPYRRLPVVDKHGKLAGLLSLDDIIDLLSEEMTQIGELLSEENPSSLGRI